jgi:hypothetical protein
MTTLNAVYNAGFRQGQKEGKGPITAAAPFKQWPLSQLMKYTSWVAGWHAGRSQQSAKAVKP